MLVLVGPAYPTVSETLREVTCKQVLVVPLDLTVMVLTFPVDPLGVVKDQAQVGVPRDPNSCFRGPASIP